MSALNQAQFVQKCNLADINTAPLANNLMNNYFESLQGQPQCSAAAVLALGGSMDNLGDYMLKSVSFITVIVPNLHLFLRLVFDKSTPPAPVRRIVIV